MRDPPVVVGPAPMLSVMLPSRISLDLRANRAISVADSTSLFRAELISLNKLKLLN